MSDEFDDYRGPNYPELRCSFCGKTQDQVRKLISGPNGVYICDECVDLCCDVLASEAGDEVEDIDADEDDLPPFLRGELPTLMTSTIH